MRPFDPRLVREVPETRRPLAVLGALGSASGVLSILQAFAVAALAVALVNGRPISSPAIAVLVLLTLRGLVVGGTELAAAWAASRVTGAVQRRRLAAWLQLPVDRRPDTATQVTLGTEGATSVQPYVARYLPALVTAAVVPALAVVALLVTDWVSAAIVVATAPLLPLFAALIGRHTQEATEQRWAQLTRLAGHFLDVVRGLPTLVGYQRAEAQVEQVRRVGDRHRRATVRTLRIAFLSSAALELLATISVAIVAVAVGLRLAYGQMDLQVGLTAILLAPEAYWPIRRVGQEFHAAADGVEALDALLPGDDEHGGLPRRPEAELPAVRLSGLSYRYPGSAHDVIHDLDTEIPVGLTAVTGPSGCGKSTLLEVLAGLREPTDGQVLAPRAHLVGQRPFIAPTTLEENLRLGDHSRQHHDAARAVLPAGIADDALLGDDGYGLSAGQRARVGLARAAASGAGFLLVDEPTAHLDPEAAESVRCELRRLAQDRVVVVVTHDPALAQLADRELALTATAVPAGPATPSDVVTDQNQEVGHRPVLPEASADAPQERRPRWLLQPAKGVLRAALLGGLAAACSVALTAASGWLIVRASTQPVVLTLMVAIVCVRAFGIGRPVFRYAERVLSHDAALGDLVTRRTAAFRMLIPLTPARLGRRRRADLLSGVVRDLDDEVDAQVRVVVPLLAASLAGLLALVVGWAIYPPAGLVIALMLAIAAVIAAVDWIAERQGQRRSIASRAQVARAAHLVCEHTTDLQAVGGERWALAELDRAQEVDTRAARRQAAGRALGNGLALVLIAVGTIAMAAAVRQGLAQGAMTREVAAMLLLAPLALGDVLATVPDAMGALARSQAAFRRVNELLAQDPAVHDHSRDTDLREGAPRLTTDQVTASWDGRTQALEPTSVQVRPGEHLAITGSNGCGKSTFLAVLARHLDPATGTYEVGRRDVRTLSLDAVRERLALVDDEPHLFGGTLRANLLLARPDAQDRDLAAALVDAGLGHWLAELPQGLDTEVGEHTGARGVSGGERARLAIARAILSRRPVVLLDEPVAHLDHPTASSVLRDLHDATRDRTLVLVTHQQVGVAHCDRTLHWGRPEQVSERTTP